MLFTFNILFLLLYSEIISILLQGIRQARREKKLIRETLPGITLIVAMRDEAKTIGNCLEALVVQDYPREKFEILLVDDASHDASLEIAKKWSLHYSFIKVLQNEDKMKWRSSKKAALEYAVANSSGSILLFTDADCTPQPGWAKAMVSCFSERTGLVAGFSPQRAKENVSWSIFLFVDSLAAAFVSAGSIGLQKGVTCAGRNLAVRTEALQEMNGYQDIPDSLSGDDDFLLQTISQSNNWEVGYCFESASHVDAVGPANFAQFIHQKQRHISAGKHYNLSAQIGFGIYHLLNYLLWISFFVGVFVDAKWIGFLIIKIIVDYSTLGYFAGRLNRHFPWWGFLCWEIVFPFYNALASPLAFFAKISW